LTITDATISSDQQEVLDTIESFEHSVTIQRQRNSSYASTESASKPGDSHDGTQVDKDDGTIPPSSSSSSSSSTAAAATTHPSSSSNTAMESTQSGKDDEADFISALEALNARVADYESSSQTAAAAAAATTSISPKKVTKPSSPPSSQKNDKKVDVSPPKTLSKRNVLEMVRDYSTQQSPDMSMDQQIDYSQQDEEASQYIGRRVLKSFAGTIYGGFVKAYQR
jgi:hypothetical protein